jgi:hypothetical protein
LFRKKGFWGSYQWSVISCQSPLPTSLDEKEIDCYENEDLPALRSFGPMGIRSDWTSRMKESFSSFRVTLTSGMDDCFVEVKESRNDKTEINE